MVAETFAQSPSAFVRRKPFRPFRVELVSGERLEVEYPDALAFRGGAAVFISPRGEFALFDHEGVAGVADISTESAAP